MILSKSAKDIRIIHTHPHSPARRVGFETGDRLIQMDDESLKDMSVKAFSTRIKERSDQDLFRFTVLRKNKPIPLALVPMHLSRSQIDERLDAFKADSQPIFEKARKLEKQKHYANAIPLYIQALNLNPYRWDGYDSLARCLDKTGKRDQAYRFLEASLSIKKIIQYLSIREISDFGREVSAGHPLS